jgi:hypothetical protein
MRKAGLVGVSLHSLRHSHASELLSQGVLITAIAERLGHANAAITHGIYSHAMPSDNQAAAMAWNNAMEDVLEASRKEALARKRRVTANDSEELPKNPRNSNQICQLVWSGRRDSNPPYIVLARIILC